VRWYCKFGISYRDLKEMMSERGVMVDYTTLLAVECLFLARWRHSGGFSE